MYSVCLCLCCWSLSAVRLDLEWLPCPTIEPVQWIALAWSTSVQKANPQKAGPLHNAPTGQPLQLAQTGPATMVLLQRASVRERERSAGSKVWIQSTGAGALLTVCGRAAGLGSQTSRWLYPLTKSPLFLIFIICQSLSFSLCYSAQCQLVVICGF